MPDFVGVLLFIFFFIVLPLLSGSSKKKKQKRQTSQRPAHVPTQPLNPPSTSSVEGDFEKRLAEARKRVREAIEKQEPQQAPTASTTYQAPPPVSKPVLPVPIPYDYSPPTPPPAPAATPKKSSLETVIPLGGSLESKIGDELKRTKGPSKLKKPLSTRPIIPSKGLLIGLESKDIMAGLIWKQVLDKPRAKRRHLGTLRAN